MHVTRTSPNVAKILGPDLLAGHQCVPSVAAPTCQLTLGALHVSTQGARSHACAIIAYRLGRRKISRRQSPAFLYLIFPSTMKWY